MQLNCNAIIIFFSCCFCITDVKLSGILRSVPSCLFVFFFRSAELFWDQITFCAYSVAATAAELCLVGYCDTIIIHVRCFRRLPAWVGDQLLTVSLQTAEAEKAFEWRITTRRLLWPRVRCLKGYEN